MKTLPHSPWWAGYVALARTCLGSKCDLHGISQALYACQYGSTAVDSEANVFGRVSFLVELQNIKISAVT